MLLLNNYKFYFLTFFATFLLLPHIANAKDTKKVAILIFDLSDKNMDNFVSWEEAQQSDKTLTKEQFDSLDLDGDGLISYEEYVELREFPE